MLKYVPFIVRQVIRRPTRTILTVGGVAVAMFLFVAVQAMQAGVEQATHTTATDTTLVVYRQNRFCPATSRLPEYYLDRIRAIPGVVSAMPAKIAVTNCGTSLDVITFRGVPPEIFAKEKAANLKILSGSVDQWLARTDAALVGQTLAQRRGFKVGDRFDAVGITVTVAGIIQSDEAQDQNVAYVHLPFLQRATGSRKLGEVTQFNVKVADPAQMDAIAKKIDAEFAKDAEPTQTSPEKAFVAKAAGDVVEMVGFTRWLGWGCLAAVLALVANAIVLSIQDRVREHAVLQTLGYSSGLIARLIVVEGVLLGVGGGLLGTVAAMAVIQWGQFTLSSEGLSIYLPVQASLAVIGLAMSAALGVLAGLVPAWQASRREIVTCFRAV